MKNIVFDLAVEHINKEDFTAKEFMEMSSGFSFHAETGVTPPLIFRYQKLLESFLKKKNIRYFTTDFKTGAFNTAISYLIEKSIYPPEYESSWEIAQKVISDNKQMLAERYNENRISLPYQVTEQYDILIEEGFQKDLFWNKDGNVRSQILTTAWFITQDVYDHAYDTLLIRIIRETMISLPFIIFCIIPIMLMAYITIAVYMIRFKVRVLDMDTIGASGEMGKKWREDHFFLFKTIILITATIINYYIYIYFFG